MCNADNLSDPEEYIRSGVLANESVTALIYKFISAIRISLLANMPGRICSVCNQAFSSSFNRLRHERTFHRNDFDDEEANVMANETVPFEGGRIVRFGEDEDEEHSSGSDEEDKEETSDSDGKDEDEGDDAPDYWRDVIAEVIEDGGLKVKAAELVLQEPFLSDFVSKIKDNVEDKVQFAKDMEEKDDCYQKINDAIEEYENKEYDREEAVEAAWHDRRFLVRRVIEKNMDLIQEVLKEEDSGEENEEESQIPDHFRQC